MGHDSHTVMSPAHRRNQNPVSPSASLFRRSSTFPREEPDLSWVAVFRRHRFLLLMLALLAFLCTIYLYFAIKLGADACSGLTGKDEALCRLEKMNAKTIHGHKRMLLNADEPRIQEHSQLQTHADFTNWMNILSEGKRIQRALVVCDTEKGFFTQYINPEFLSSLPGTWCETYQKYENLRSTLLQKKDQHTSQLLDLIICGKCNMLECLNDKSKFWKLDRLVREGGFFMWILETTAKSTSCLSLQDLQLHGWSCLSSTSNFNLLLSICAFHNPNRLPTSSEPIKLDHYY